MVFGIMSASNDYNLIISSKVILFSFVQAGNVLLQIRKVVLYFLADQFGGPTSLSIWINRVGYVCRRRLCYGLRNLESFWRGKGVINRGGVWHIFGRWLHAIVRQVSQIWCSSLFDLAWLGLSRVFYWWHKSTRHQSYFQNCRFSSIRCSILFDWLSACQWTYCLPRHQFNQWIWWLFLNFCRHPKSQQVVFNSNHKICS